MSRMTASRNLCQTSARRGCTVSSAALTSSQEGQIRFRNSFTVIELCNIYKILWGWFVVNWIYHTNKWARNFIQHCLELCHALYAKLGENNSAKRYIRRNNRSLEDKNMMFREILYSSESVAIESDKISTSDEISVIFRFPAAFNFIVRRSSKNTSTSSCDPLRCSSGSQEFVKAE